MKTVRLYRPGAQLTVGLPSVYGAEYVRFAGEMISEVSADFWERLLEPTSGVAPVLRRHLAAGDLVVLDGKGK